MLLHSTLFASCTVHTVDVLHTYHIMPCFTHLHTLFDACKIYVTCISCSMLLSMNCNGLTVYLRPHSMEFCVQCMPDLLWWTGGHSSLCLLQIVKAWESISPQFDMQCTNAHLLACIEDHSLFLVQIVKAQLSTFKVHKRYEHATPYGKLLSMLYFMWWVRCLYYIIMTSWPIYILGSILPPVGILIASTTMPTHDVLCYF